MADYPNKEFQDLYDNLKTSLGGDEATLRANLEAALRPMYDQSRAQLEEQRRANNATIDVDAYSRGMGNSTWVTDAKLQQLRGLNNSLASLEANYNNQLYSQLLNALQDRDDTAWNRAMQMYQLNHSGGSGGGSGSGQNNLDWLLGRIGQITEQKSVDPRASMNTLLDPPQGVKPTNRAIVNPWNYGKVEQNVTRYTR